MTLALIDPSELGTGGTLFIEDMALGERGYAVGPERELLSALLFDGIQSYLNYAGAEDSEAKSKYREAYAWIHRRGDEYIFSFENVCEGLGIDADYLRYGLANVCASGILKGKRRSTRI